MLALVALAFVDPASFHDELLYVTSTTDVRTLDGTEAAVDLAACPVSVLRRGAGAGDFCRMGLGRG